MQQDWSYVETDNNRLLVTIQSKPGSVGCRCSYPCGGGCHPQQNCYLIRLNIQQSSPQYKAEITSRIQLLPTSKVQKANNLFTWDPETHSPHCSVHSKAERNMETIAHICCSLFAQREEIPCNVKINRFLILTNGG